MKKLFLLILILPLLSCGIKKDLANAQQKKIELEKKLAEVEKKQNEIKQKNQELSKQNEEYRIKIRKLNRINQPVHAPKVEKIFSFVEESPEFPGGEEKLFEFMAKNISYPSQAKTDSIEGTVYVQFVVEKNGELTDIRIVRGIGHGCDKEVLKMIGLMPRWNPAEQRGVAVRQRMTLPVKFVLR
ncbi:MAG: TonB family protein [Flavobacteriales bacterium]